MENYSAETWKALAEVDPKGTFNKLVKYLEIDFSTAENILLINKKNYHTACLYTLEKFANKLTDEKSKSVTDEINQTSKEGNGAIWSLIFGLFSFIAWLYPVCGFPISLIGIYQGVTNLNSKRKKIALIGTIISFIGFSFTLINSALGAYLGYTGQLFNLQQTVITTSTPTSQARPIASNIPPTQTQNAYCLHWSEITPKMEDRITCIYGIVNE